MLAEPDLDHRALAAALDEHHGLAPRTLRFVPAGETAWSYRLTDDRGGRWFLKLARPGAIDPARAEFALELAGALATLGLPVPRPRPTRSGGRWCRLDGLRMAVFELVDADPLDDRALAEPATAKRVARLVAAIHAATPARGPAHHAGARAGPGSRCRHTASGAGAVPPRPHRRQPPGGPGRAGLDPDLVAFFLLRRNLDDLADWLGAALEADQPNPQRRADLDGVRWCLSRRPELEARIDHTRRPLAQRRRIS